MHDERIKEQIQAEIDNEMFLLEMVEERHALEPCHELFSAMCIHMRKIKQLSNELAGY